jgi:hypothetical protein
MRRGEMAQVAIYNDPQLFKVEQFIGLFVFHFAAAYVMTAFVTIVIVWIVSVDVVRIYIWNKIFTAFVASAASIAVTLFLRLFQEHVLMDGTHVVRPNAYGAYSFVDLVLGVFTGLWNTIVRMALAVFFIVGAFAKLDETLFPAAFAFMDTGLIGFSSLLTTEARNSNPIMLCAASWMLTDQAIRRTVAQLQAREEYERNLPKTAENTPGAAFIPPTTAAATGVRWIAAEVRDLVERHREARADTSSRVFTIDVEHFGKAIPRQSTKLDPREHPVNGTEMPSPMMINFGRVWLRWLQRPHFGNDVPLELWHAPEDPYYAVAGSVSETNTDDWRLFNASRYISESSPTRRRIARRWQLAVLLLQNPSLIQFRKQRIAKDDADEPEPNLLLRCKNRIMCC